MTILKVLEASTGNVLPTTMARINDDSLAITTMNSEHGSFLAVLQSRDLEQELINDADLFPLFDAARAADCTWIYLDKDADFLEGVPDYLEFWS
jgi:hypothetical protein